MKENKEESNVGKHLLGLYISKFQKEAIHRFDEPRKVDFSWPFKVWWSVLAGLRGLFFSKRGEPPAT